VSVTTPDCVIREIFEQLAAPIVLHKQNFWWGHQDLWVVKRDK
jgi:hypothetical protein